MTTIYQLHRATPAQCPPCHGQCQQGRQCNAAADTDAAELLENEANERRLRNTARFWALYLAVVLVAVCAGIAHFLPALSALVN
jgi:hypothetical protein